MTIFRLKRKGEDYKKKQLSLDINLYSGDRIVFINEINKIPDSCGIYILTTKNGKIYIGRSAKIMHRIRGHMRWISPDNPIVLISIYITKNIEQAIFKERQMIIELKPELNKNYPYKNRVWRWDPQFVPEPSFD